MRKFEKISLKQFKKDISNDLELYNSYNLPKRSTSHSAGYDIRSLTSGIIKPNETLICKTGLKVCMESDEVLYIYVRSSLGYKYDVCLSNAVGVIDSDFYNNEDNEGHFSVKLRNQGTKDFEVNIGDRIAQGVFSKYLVVSDEEEIKNKRKGGVGSTNEVKK